MAGLGEACSHISALLFSTEANTQTRKNTSCTSTSCTWLVPSLKKVEYAPICDIDFTTPQKRRKTIEGNLSCSLCTTSSSLKDEGAEKPTEEELEMLYKKLSECKKMPSLLSIVPGYCDAYIPRSESGSLPKPLTSLFNEELIDASYSQVVDKSEETLRSIAISTEQAKSLELLTRGQSHSKLWYQYRAGRITASKFKNAVHTDVAHPSQSLIKRICYPESFKFKTQSTCWGLEHEKQAIADYCAHNKDSHSCLTFTKSGLVINPAYPHLGATPDGIVQCMCCGKGVVEVKCPYNCKDKSFEIASDDSTFCLRSTTDSNFMLRTEHAYYYQVQLQMKVCEADYCDFVVWRPTEIAVIRIIPDKTFIDSAIDQATAFYKFGVLPELIGKWYSKIPTFSGSDSSLQIATSISNDTVSTTNDDGCKKWCYCQGEEHGTMIGCDNEKCSIGWFHIDCLKIQNIPSGNWYCSDCRKNM